jgi:uncharacterized protein (TIGR03435 family)
LESEEKRASRKDAKRTALHGFDALYVLLIMAAFRSLIFAAALAVASGQAPAVRKEFDVVSVKPSAPDEHNSFMFQSLAGGTLRLVGIPLRMLIMRAYDVKAFQIAGGPDWIRTERWDITAKAEGVEGRLARADENPMVQALMKDRFQLKIRRETREMPVYALVVEKNGSKLVSNAGGESEFRTAHGSLMAKKGAIAGLVAWLSRELGRVVIDKTELKGAYDYALDFTPEPGQGGPESIGMSPDTKVAPPTETNGPSIFTALQEQLGLRLVSQKGLVEILVIDSVQRASAN